VKLEVVFEVAAAGVTTIGEESAVGTDFPPKVTDRL
jgi:hypothetical protein